MKLNAEKTFSNTSYSATDRGKSVFQPIILVRRIRSMVDEAMKTMSSRFDEIYPEEGRKSIRPERLLRALLLQLLYAVRSERMLMEQIEYDLLFRWFVD